MKVTSHIFPFPLPFLFILGCLFNSCTQPDWQTNRNLKFNIGWKFLEDGLAGAQASDFVDSVWNVVELPHDWSIYDLLTGNSAIDGPFSRDIP